MHITKKFGETFKSIYGNYTSVKLKSHNETMVYFNNQPDCYLRYKHQRGKCIIVYPEPERKKEFVEFISKKYNIDEEFERRIQTTKVYVIECSRRKR